jgi:capsular exopolysaccharide synthesis family protein
METDMGYGKLFAVLLRRKWWVVGCVGLGIAGALVVNLFSRSTYRSQMQLLVEPNYRSRSKDESPITAETNVQIDYATQLTLMRSSQMFERARQILASRYPGIGSELGRSLRVEQISRGQTATKIIAVDYTSDSPTKTRDVLKAFEQVYLEYNREQQEKRLTSGLEFIDKQIPKARQKIAEATNDLESFRRKHNLFDASQRMTEVTAALSSIEQQRRATTLELQQVQSRYDTLQQSLGRSPAQAAQATRLAQSGTFQTLEAEIQKVRVQLLQEETRFTALSPTVRALRDRLRQLEAAQARERQRLTGGEAAATSGLDQALASQLIEAASTLRQLQARQQVLSRQEQELRAEIKRLPRLLSEYEALRPRLQVEQNALEELLKLRQQLSVEQARGGFDWQVIEQPREGIEEPPSHRRNLLLGVIAGAFIGCGLAFLRDLQDDTVHTTAELEQQSTLTLLGITPRSAALAAPKSGNFLPPFLKGQSSSTLACRSATDVLQWTPFRAAMDLIYKNIRLLEPRELLRSITITSALRGEGKSTISLGLASSAARMHQRVLLVDGDLTTPSLHGLLRLPNERGLSTLLADPLACHIEDVICKTESGIDVLPAGPIPQDSARLLSGPTLRKLIAHLEHTYDLIILDTPPVLETVDALEAASACRGVILVGRISQVTRSEFQEAMTVLQSFNLIGAIANGAQKVRFSQRVATVLDLDDADEEDYEE